MSERSSKTQSSILGCIKYVTTVGLCPTNIEFFKCHQKEDFHKKWETYMVYLCMQHNQVHS